MKRIIIYGAGVKGVFLNCMLRNRSETIYEGGCQILYFCDTYKRPGSYVDGTEIISPKQLKQLENEVDEIVISSISYADEIQKELNDLKIKTHTYVVPEYVYRFMWNKSDMPFKVDLKLDKPRLPYLEIGIVKHCNLNCKGCSALANISEPEVMEIDEFRTSMERLKELFWGIKDLKLFGGEPLLHPDLKQLILIARECFPDSNLIVHSNGLLIPQMDESLFLLMHNKNVMFEFTQYPSTGLKKRIIIKILEKYGVNYKFREALYEFEKVLNLKGDYVAEEVYKTCEGCISLIKGTLSCGLGYVIKSLEEKYSVKICEDKFQHCIDIFNTELDGWEINHILHTPFNLCQYCAFMNADNVDERMVKWECGGPFSLSDWGYMEEENK